MYKAVYIHFKFSYMLTLFRMILYEEKTDNLLYTVVGYFTHIAASASNIFDQQKSLNDKFLFHSLLRITVIIFRCLFLKPCLKRVKL